SSASRFSWHCFECPLIAQPLLWLYARRRLYAHETSTRDGLCFPGTWYSVHVRPDPTSSTTWVAECNPGGSISRAPSQRKAGVLGRESTRQSGVRSGCRTTASAGEPACDWDRSLG